MCASGIDIVNHGLGDGKFGMWTSILKFVAFCHQDCMP